MRGAGLFFFLLFLLVIFAYAGWVGWTQYRARRAGLPPPTWKHYVPFVKSDSSSTNYPTPRSAGPLEWIKDQVDKLRNRRTARGAYEGDASGEYAPAGAARGRGRQGGFEDDAWDTRVGGPSDDYGAPGGSGQDRYATAGYEEQELGLSGTPTTNLRNEPYGGATDYQGYEQDRDRGMLGADDPFGDQHQAPSLRSVSPRPEVDTRGASRHGGGEGSINSLESPTGTRKSAFREGI